MKGFPNSTIKRTTKIAILVLFVISAIAVPLAQSRDLNVRVDRWLTLQQLKGQVMLWKNQSSRTARSGDRLQVPGDGVSTGANSSTILAIDLGIGQVNVAERTRVNIRSLRTTPNGGRVTQLNVPVGRVQLKVRPFSNPDSKIEIETPSGVAGVRGTEFGINIQGSGKMSLATREGSVESIAQGQSVFVDSGFQNFTIPGESPSEPVPITNDTRLNYQFVRRIENGVRKLRLEGKVDPVNLVLINDVEQSTDRNGRFNVELATISFPQIRVTVVTPLGLRRNYELEFR